MNIDDMCGLDFETYSGTDLKRHGLERYVTCPTFQPLIASVAARNYGNTGYRKTRLDLVRDKDVVNTLELLIGNRTIVAHNAGFEQRVLKAMGINLPSTRFVDSAVLARAAGAGGSLEAAAPQLLGVDKLEDGKRLIQLFSVPGKYQEAADSRAFDPQIIEDYADDWRQFGVYCDLDAELGLRLAEKLISNVGLFELDYMAITMDMNRTGWPVDLAVVEEMQRRYLENQEAALMTFREQHDAHELNLNSLQQMKEWCEKRGIKANSFNEENVAKLIERIDKKLDSFVHDYHSGGAKPDRYDDYLAVRHLLETKQTLGGSSLKKLQVILDTVGLDGRLRDQYIHIGAGQTYRTTGRSVQMQNLKRLDGDNIARMEELYEDTAVDWDNEKLAENIRQGFTSSDPAGQLIVGDFSSVEGRGLAWLAGANDKLIAYRKGLDLYKVQAAKIYDVAYDNVTKAQRQTGKVGELSCGYGAGGGAVVSFAAGMGVTLTEGEANQLVGDWRLANPEIVALWDELDRALDLVMEGKIRAKIPVGPNKDFTVELFQAHTPVSLINQHKGVQSIGLGLYNPDGTMVLTRVFHGCYRRGRNVCYYKPSERKNGDLWSASFTDPKTKQRKFYSIYGGKLAGILTQSFCREIFFRSLKAVHAWVQVLANVDLIGQFHDEIVLDWRPPVPAITDPWEVGRVDLDGAKQGLKLLMSDASDFPGFPLEADIKHDYRYTK